MNFLLFQLGNDRYALEASRIVEVLPLVELRRIPQAPRGVAGIFNYHGTPVPVVDLGELTLGRASGQRMSTRIIVIQYPDETGKKQPLGLIAEHATEIIRRKREDFIEQGLKGGQPDYLGPVLMDYRGAIHWVQEQHLLPDPVRDVLFCETITEQP
jgi:chemotaxis-related protein WspB